MGLRKGQTNNLKGRPTGTTNERTKAWERLGESIITRHAARFNEILESCSDTEFTKNYAMILDYFKPRLARTDLTSTDGSMSFKVKIKKDA